MQRVRYGHAFARVADRALEQTGQRHPAAHGRANLESFLPPGDRARHSQCRQRPARGDRVIPGVLVEVRVGQSGSRAASVDAEGRFAALADEPEIVAAQRIHMRVGHHDRGRRRNHGLDGIAALAQDGATGFRRQVMRRDDHAILRADELRHYFKTLRSGMRFAPGAAAPHFIGAQVSRVIRPRGGNCFCASAWYE